MTDVENPGPPSFSYLIGYANSPAQGSINVGSRNVTCANPIRTDEDVLALERFLREDKNDSSLVVISFSLYAVP